VNKKCALHMKCWSTMAMTNTGLTIRVVTIDRPNRGFVELLSLTQAAVGGRGGGVRDQRR